jgi:hypothetical protein
MGWKRVAWIGCLTPVFGGCFGPFHADAELPPGALVSHTQAAIESEIRHDARAAWREVRNQYARRAFSAEFRDGFIDGYTDYLDRGGAAQPPATPPLRYTRHQKYYTPEGHALIRDYYLGFQYGVDVAIATGQRQYLTVPILIPDVEAAPPAIPAVPIIPLNEAVPLAPTVPTVPSPGPSGEQPLPMTPIPLPGPRPVGPQVPQVPPVESRIPGYHQTTWNERSGRRPQLPRIGPAVPKASAKAEPAPEADSIGSKFGSAPSLVGADTPVPSVIPSPPVKVDLPEPPHDVPDLPEWAPTPPVFDEFPVLPPIHSSPPPIPATHPEPTRE